MLNKRPWTIITGATSGIGYAIFKRLYSRNAPMILVSRNVHTLEQELTGSKQVRLVKADLATEDGYMALLHSIGYNESVKRLIHCAGTIQPLGHCGTFTQNELRHILQLNVYSPFAISLSLYHKAKFVDRSRILHIGSLAAHVPFAEWSTYCISKAAFYSVHKHFQASFKERGVLVGSVMPGPVDTAMVKSTAAYADEQFRKRLLTPDTAARFIDYILDEEKVSSEQFVKKEWDIYDEWHHKYWKIGGDLTVL